MLASSRQLSTGNRILDALPHDELARLLPSLETVDLKKGEIVYLIGDDIEYAYFPENGLLSLVSITEAGSTMEVAMVGNEGVVGLPVIFIDHMIPYDVTVQFDTRVLKIKAEALQEEFDKGQTLHQFVLRYLSVLIAQISQGSICNRFHFREQAFRRWLLTVHDRVNSNSLDLTQEDISNALGIPRTAVTKAAATMQRDGLIRYSRGKIIILNRAKIEEEACECYHIIRDQLQHFLNK
jgi:CRP-like cAMP-binding protein